MATSTMILPMASDQSKLSQLSREYFVGYCSTGTSQQGKSATNGSTDFSTTLRFSPGDAQSLPHFIASMGKLVDVCYAGPPSSSIAISSDELETTYAEGGLSETNLMKLDVDVEGYPEPPSTSA